MGVHVGSAGVDMVVWAGHFWNSLQNVCMEKYLVLNGQRKPEPSLRIGLLLSSCRILFLDLGLTSEKEARVEMAVDVPHIHRFQATLLSGQHSL